MVTILVVLFVILCPLIIFLVLVQDPKGGGLAGVLGGAGGSSAFGAKTADVVMKTTVALGIVFFLLAVGLGIKLKHPTTETTTKLTSEEPPIEAPATAPGGDVEAGQPAPATPGAPAGGSVESAPAEESAAPAEGAATPAGPAEDAAAPAEGAAAATEAEQ